MLRTIGEARRWRDKLGSVVHAYNSSWNEATGYSPFYLMFGRQPKLPLDFVLGVTGSPNDTAENEVDFPAHVEKLKDRLKEAYQLASQRNSLLADQAKSKYHQGVRGATLSVGDKVLVRNTTRAGKLEPFWLPNVFIVVSQPKPDIPVYCVQDVDKSGPVRVLHRNLLLPVFSIPSNDDPETKGCGCVMVEHWFGK